jgi:hypothetical protein
MRRTIPLSLFALLTGGFLLSAQDERILHSGPKKGEFLPAAFDCYNFNGPHKGRFHCLVCRYGLTPAVLVFVREQPDENRDVNVNLLLKQLEDAMVEFKKHEFHAAAVYLSPDAKPPATEAPAVDGDKLAEEARRLVEEAKKREELYARMAARAENYKAVDIGVYAQEGPKDYKLNPKADVTVLLYGKLKVVGNWAYGPQGLSEEDVGKIMAKVKETVEPPAKK